MPEARVDDAMDDKMMGDISNCSNNNHNIINLLEETASQSSTLTKTNGPSFMNVNKALSKDDQNNFASKKFLNLQLLLGGLLLSLLILMIILIIELKIIKSDISQYYIF